MYAARTPIWHRCRYKPHYELAASFKPSRWCAAEGRRMCSNAGQSTTAGDECPRDSIAVAREGQFVYGMAAARQAGRRVQKCHMREARGKVVPP